MADVETVNHGGAVESAAVGNSQAIDDPLGLIRLSLDERVYIKLRNDRELVGRLHAFDQHLNMILGDVEETLTTVTVDEDTFEEMYKQQKRHIPMLFVSSVGLALIVGTLAAYAFSRFPLRGNDTYLFIILTTRMMPPIVVIIPIFLMFRLSGLAGTYWGIILLYTAFNIPFSVWLIKSFFDELNPEIEDAARMDGSTESRVFFGFCIPQILAGLSATFVFGLILTWNEFLFALLLTGVETRTVPVAMARTLGGEVGVDYGLLAAIVTLFLIPIFFVTFLLQNQLLRGVTFGTVKK
jgi:ABC-type glycerol-3-phosphate transport system permease component